MDKDEWQERLWDIVNEMTPDIISNDPNKFEEINTRLMEHIHNHTVPAHVCQSCVLTRFLTAAKLLHNKQYEELRNFIIATTHKLELIVIDSDEQTPDQPVSQSFH